MRTSPLLLAALAAASPASADEPGTPPAWTQRLRVSPTHPYHLADADGRHVFILNKTAWHYFSCAHPEITLARAHALGANIVRVGLETRYYHDDIGLDAWPWGGTRDNPDFTTFPAAYWDEVERRLERAAAAGIGVNLTLFTSLQLPDTPESFERVRPYLDETLRRLAPHPNVFCWEVHNEHVQNPGFQRRVAEYLRARDPGRPVITSNGTTDSAQWPHEPWLDLAVVHHCTGSTPSYDLRDWYLAIARGIRVYGKPGYNNETGRERRHRNDDPVHRRKQLWLSAAAGTYTTWHSWDGCEGIDDAVYAAPGQEFVRPFATWWRAQPFWRVDPDFACVQLEPDPAAPDDPLVVAALASPARDIVIAYLFTRPTGHRAEGRRVRLRLPDGDYRIAFVNPADGSTAAPDIVHAAPGLRRQVALDLPAFTDDLALRIERTVTRDATSIPGTH